MRPARWLAAALVWLACVTVVATVTWVAVDSAGRQVSVLTAGSPPAPGTAAGAGPQVSARPSGRPPGAGSASGPSTGPAAEPSARRTAPPRTSSTRRGPASPRPASPRPEPTDREPWPGSGDHPAHSPAPDPAARTRTLQTRGGEVTVTCPAEDAAAPDDLVEFTVRPTPGWSAHGERSGRHEVEITLRRDPEKVEVHAHCVDGVPRVEQEEPEG